MRRRAVSLKAVSALALWVLLVAFASPAAARWMAEQTSKKCCGMQCTCGSDCGCSVKSGEGAKAALDAFVTPVSFSVLRSAPLVILAPVVFGRRMNVEAQVGVIFPRPRSPDSPRGPPMM